MLAVAEEASATRTGTCFCVALACRMPACACAIRACADSSPAFFVSASLVTAASLSLAACNWLRSHARGRGVGIIFQARNLFLIHQRLHAVQIGLRVIGGGLRGLHIGARHGDIGGGGALGFHLRLVVIRLGGAQLRFGRGNAAAGRVAR